MKNRRKTILLTGASGFLGCHLLSAIEAADPGYKVFTLSRRALSRKWHLRHDLNKPLETGFPRSLDFVVHAAGRVDQSGSSAEIVTENVQTTHNLVQYAIRSGASSLVVISSIAVYGEPRKLPMDETHPTMPVSMYGAGKLAAEGAARSLTHGQLPLSILRCGYVVGPNPPSRYFIPRMIRGILAGKLIELNRPDRTLFNMVDVDDVSKAVLRCLRSPADRIVNLVPDRPITLAQVGRCLSRVYPQARFSRGRSAGIEVVHRMRFSNRRFRALLRGKRPLSPREAVHRMIWSLTGGEER